MCIACTVPGMYGLMSITGSEDGPPAKTGVALIDVATGLFAHGAILAALHSRCVWRAVCARAPSVR